MAGVESYAKEKLTEYLKLAAVGNSKTDEEIERDASDIVETTMMGAIEKMKQQEQDTRRRGG